MRQRSESGRWQGKWIPGKRAINHYQDEISAETKIRKRIKEPQKEKNIPKEDRSQEKRQSIIIKSWSKIRSVNNQKRENLQIWNAFAAYNHIPEANIKELLQARVANLKCKGIFRYVHEFLFCSFPFHIQDNTISFSFVLIIELDSVKAEFLIIVKNLHCHIPHNR